MKKEQVRDVVLAALNYAMEHRLPLPHHIWQQYNVLCIHKEWIDEQISDDSKPHYDYYNFAIYEYNKARNYLLMENKDKEIDLFFGLRILRRSQNLPSGERENDFNGAGEGNSENYIGNSQQS